MTLPMRIPIDIAKGITAPVLFALMAAYDTWTAAAWVYLGLHGTYGVLWVLKSRFFPDPGWERQVSLLAAAGTFVALWFYWVAGWLLIAGGQEAPGPLIAAAVSANALGTFLVFGADAQKYFVLKARRGLITDGFFSRTRNPNYLGEILIYGSFAALSMHWLPWVICACYWVYFFRNMRRKDASMSRYPEWAWYTARTGLLLPQWSQPDAPRPEGPA